MALLPDVPQTTIAGSVLILRGDDASNTTDTDTDLDLGTLFGIVVFAPSVSVVHLLGSDGTKSTVVLEPVVAEFQDSVLTLAGRETPTSPRLLASGSGKTIPESFTYTAKFDLLNDKGQTINIPSFTFELFQTEGDVPVSLTELFPEVMAAAVVQPPVESPIGEVE